MQYIVDSLLLVFGGRLDIGAAICLPKRNVPPQTSHISIGIG